MTLLAFVAGAAVGTMFMGFCFSRSMLKFANAVERLSFEIKARGL